MKTLCTKRDKLETSPYSGGYVLSLDMSAAFDSIPRIHIYNALMEAQVEPGDVALIMTWLYGSCYHLKHSNVSLIIRTDRGVRQGCELSPLIWSCFMCYVMKRLDKRIQMADVQMCADDFLLSWIFHTKQQLKESFNLIPIFLKHLCSYGLKINVSKTVLLHRVAEQIGRDLLKPGISHTGKGKYLCISGTNPEYIYIYIYPSKVSMYTLDVSSASMTLRPKRFNIGFDWDKDSTAGSRAFSSRTGT